MAGYSKRTLVEKLGIKDSYRILFINSPDNYRKLLGKIPQKAQFEKEYRDLDLKDTYDFIQFFVTNQEALGEMFPIFVKHLMKSGMLWISWPKGAYCTFVGSDLNENIIRDIGLKNGVVDVKVIAVDENWSGLKFVYRLKDR